MVYIWTLGLGNGIGLLGVIFRFTLGFNFKG